MNGVLIEMENKKVKPHVAQMLSSDKKTNMDAILIKKALCFHGKPMQKIWDDERGAGDLQILGVPEDGNYSIYMDRQKYFTFQDRAKRLKLHQFLARKAVDLFDKDLSKSLIQGLKTKECIEKAKHFVAEVPPYELFIAKNQEKVKRHILESIKPGDIIYATVARSKLPATSKTTIKIAVSPVCMTEPSFKLLNEYKLKALIPPQLYEPSTIEKNNKSRGIDGLEYLRCEVIEVSIDADRLTLSLLHASTKNKNIKLGFIAYEDMPQLYRLLSEKSIEQYEAYLKKAKEFENPNYEVLYTLNGLDVNDNFSLMTNLKYDFPQQEYAKELRQVQASKWAFRSVAEGIEYFKVGQHVEAFQCLNKALNIDPRNVEGLVARGALYANKGSFLKAVEDFEKALKLNAYHVNARKYMGETLVALGRSYEEDNRIQEAAKAYRDCLNIIPNHEQARLSLEAIQYRTGATIEPIIPSEIPSVPSISSENVQQQLRDFEEKIIVQSSSNDESSNDSSGSETEGSDECHTKDPSLSPLSKKMVMHRACLESNQKAQEQYNQSYFQANQKPIASNPVLPNEFKLDDDDTESRVQKLLQKAYKHKKEKKKSKKLKKSKKSKKDKTSKSSSSMLNKINFQEAYNLLGGGIQFESTLNDNLKMYEQTIQEIRKRQEVLQKSISASTSTLASTSAGSNAQVQHRRSETPPPPPLKPILPTSSTYVYKSINFSKNNYTTPAPKPSAVGQPKLSFQIKKPVKVDKFGLIRLATPALQSSPTPSPPPAKGLSRSPRSRQRSRSRSRNGTRKGTSRSLSRSRSRSRNAVHKARYRSRRSSSSYSRSRSRSRSRYSSKRYNSRGKSSGKRSVRRSPSPFVPRGTPSPNSRYRRSRSPRFNRRSPRSRRYSRSPKRFPAAKFGNRTWQRPGFKPRVIDTPSNSSEGKWLHDKFEDKNDGPSIEEIDEIISKAQKERKQDIINRDKTILKKTNN